MRPAEGAEAVKAQTRSIARDVMFQSGSRYLGAVLGVARGLLIPKFLAPGVYGVYKTYQTVSELSRVLTLGIPSALFRELPISQSRGEEVRRRALLDNAFWSQVASALPIAVAFLVGGFAGWFRFEDVTLNPWYLLFIPLLFVDRTKIIFDVVFNGQKQFVLQAQFRLLDEVLTTLLCIVAAWRFGFEGLLVASLVVNVIMTALAWRGSRYRLGANLDAGLAREMVGIGFPHMLNGLCNSVYNQLDRLVILGAGLGMSAVGFYSVGMTIADQIVAGAMILARVVMPRMMEQYGLRESVEDIRHLVLGPARFSGLVYAGLVGVVALVGEVVFGTLLTKYGEGLVPMQIMMIGTFFLAIWASVQPFFLAVKRQWNLVAYFAATIPLALVLLTGAVMLGWGLPGVAAASAVTDCVFASVVLGLALKSFTTTWRERVTEILRIFAPIVVAAAIYLVAREIRSLASLAEDPVRGALLASGVFTVLYGAFAGALLATARGRRFYGVDALHG